MLFITKIEGSEMINKVCELIKRENNLPNLEPQNIINSPHYIAVDGEDIIGVVAIGRSNWFSTEVFHLSILPQFRRKGYGKALVDFASYHAKNVLGKKVLTCTVRSDNKASIALMKKCGFSLATEFNNSNGQPISFFCKNL